MKDWTGRRERWQADRRKKNNWRKPDSGIACLVTTALRIPIVPWLLFFCWSWLSAFPLLLVMCVVTESQTEHLRAKLLIYRVAGLCPAGCSPGLQESWPEFAVVTSIGFGVWLPTPPAGCNVAEEAPVSIALTCRSQFLVHSCRYWYGVK